VVSAAHGACRVRSGDEVLAAMTRLALVVGDEVWIGERSGVLEVREVLPRRTRLSRPEPHRPEVEQVLAANVDVGVIVVALGAPPLRPGLVDRFLAALAWGGIAPLMCVNKVDLVAPPERAAALRPLAPYAALGVPALACSAASGEGMAELAAALAGRVGVLVGQSGVGKSSLLNALDPRLDLRTGAPRAGDGKGRHTTTAAGFYALPGGGGLIDTPGVRQFGLWEIAPEELAALFPEIAAAGLACRFRDCRHASEPGCAARAAAEAGAVAPARYAAYRRILESLGSATLGA
jgi:ribosome biogenesis GTPase